MTPAHVIRGLVREHLMPADSRIACSHYLARDIFDRLIDVSVHPGGSPPSAVRRRLQHDAKEICGGCTVRLQCLAVHGPDLELGVVGGLTDAERARMFGVAS